MERESRGEVDLPSWTLSEAEYRAAVDLYRRRFAEAFERLRPGGTSTL